MREPNYCLSRETVHYWTLNSFDNQVVWVRATGVKAFLSGFGACYVGTSDTSAPTTPKTYAVTHPASGRRLSNGDFPSPEAALDSALKVLVAVGPARATASLTTSARYQKPALDPAQCDQVMVPAEQTREASHA